MNLNPLSWFRRSDRRPRTRVPAKSEASGLLFGTYDTTDSAGVEVDERKALEYSAWWCGISLISQAVAALPKGVYEDVDGVRREVTGHPLNELLRHSPNPEQIAFNFFETGQAYLLGRGNTYAEIEFRNDGSILALWPLPPWSVEPMRDERTGDLYYRFGDRQDLSADQVLHVAGLGDGVVGYDVVRYGRQSIGLGIAQGTAAASLFANGMQISGFLQHPGELSANAANRIRDEFNGRHQGLSKRDRLAVLEEGMTFKEGTFSPESAQLIQSRQYQLVEIAQRLNLPPHKLKDLSRATFSNIEHQALEFIQDTLRPWVSKWCGELRRKLLSEADKRRGYYVDVDYDDLLRGDSVSLVDSLSKSISGGLRTVNEARAKLNLGPVEGGDKLRIPVNTQPIDQLTGGPDLTGAGFPARRSIDYEQLDLIADILGGLFGDKALDLFDEWPGHRAWDEAQHPRGPGGRFIKAGSAEAASTAKDAIDKVLLGARTGESHKKVVEHLALLTVKQLHEVKKKYGLKASAKDKASLVAKLAERIHGKKPEKPDEKKPDPPVKEIPAMHGFNDRGITAKLAGLSQELDQAKADAEDAEKAFSAAAKKAGLKPVVGKVKDRLFETRRKLRGLQDSANAKAYKAMELPAAERHKFVLERAQGLTEKNAKEVDEAVTWLGTKVAKSATPSIEVDSLPLILDDQRARAFGSKVTLGNYGGVPTAIHEIGHVVENTNPGVRRAAQDFLSHRTKGEDLKHMGKGFEADEFGRDDQFGKVFGDRGRYVGKEIPWAWGSTEIISMGLEQMHRDPVKFASKDPEYFRFVLAVMHGHIR